MNRIVPTSAHIQQEVTIPTGGSPSDPELAEPVTAESNPSASSAVKGNDDCSLHNGFTVEQLSTHLESLNRSAELSPAKLKQKCSEVLKGLQTHQHGWVFNFPVDPVELGLPDYFEIIKKPIDLGTVHKKLDSGAYHAIKDFNSDVNLTFDNAMTYNEKFSVVYDMAKELKTKFEVDCKKWSSNWRQKIEKEDKTNELVSSVDVKSAFLNRLYSFAMA